MSSKKSNISNRDIERPQDMGVGPQTSKKPSRTARLQVEALAAGGRGVARSEGLVWFVAGGLPGDIVLAEPVRRRASFVEATVAEIVEPSPERRSILGSTGWGNEGDRARATSGWIWMSEAVSRS